MKMAIQDIRKVHFLHRYLEIKYLCGFGQQKQGSKIPELQSKVKKIDTGGEVLCIQKKMLCR